MAKEKKEYDWFHYDLILENGKEIEVEIREDSPEIYDDMHIHFEGNLIWIPQHSDDYFQIKYLNHFLNEIDFKKVIGIGY